MIDVENLVYTEVARAIRLAVPSAYVSSEYENDYSKLPAVHFAMAGNTTNTASATLDSRENHAYITFQGFVYAKDKATAKNIANVIDTKMLQMGFNRTFYEFVPNMDRNIKRIALRYSALVSKGITIGENTIYLTYTR